MKSDFNNGKWLDFIPRPVFYGHERYNELYYKTWQLARNHVKAIDGMPESPYMDEGFCDTQIWIWDTCFMSLFCKYAQTVFPGKETFKNFYEVLYDGKVLPAIIPTENEPKWTGAIAGKPFNIQINIADNPPLFAWAEYENALFNGDKNYVRTLLYEKKYLQKHYEWLENLIEPANVEGVSVPTCWIKCENGYKWEGGRSGMDNTPRGRLGDKADKERPNNPDMLWIDAICQQALAAKSIAELFEIVGDENSADIWNAKYFEKKETINRFYWDKEDNFYYDIDRKDYRFYKVPTIASYWTLTAKIADKEQARFMAKYVFDYDKFGGEVPLVSLSRNDADFSVRGNYWRGSMWLPTAYAALKGLVKYGYYEEARAAAVKILDHMSATFNEYEPHTVWECYSPTEHKPATQTNDKSIVRSDFCGWSALGPISIYIEFVLGFYEINAFKSVIKWAKPLNAVGQIGIKNLRFGNVITDIVAEEDKCFVSSNGNYDLIINGVVHKVKVGKNIIDLVKV